MPYKMTFDREYDGDCSKETIKVHWFQKVNISQIIYKCSDQILNQGISLQKVCFLATISNNWLHHQNW